MGMASKNVEDEGAFLNIGNLEVDERRLESRACNTDSRQWENFFLWVPIFHGGKEGGKNSVQSSSQEAEGSVEQKGPK